MSQDIPFFPSQVTQNNGPVQGNVPDNPGPISVPHVALKMTVWCHLSGEPGVRAEDVSAVW